MIIPKMGCLGQRQRVRLEKNSLISIPCGSSAEELNAGDHQLGRGAFDGFFEGLGEASVAAKPSEGKTRQGKG